MNARERQRLMGVAHHEAGHVIVANFLQVRTCEVSISIEPDEIGRDGHTRYDARQMRGVDPSAQAIVCLAGREAQRKFDRRSWRRWHTEQDERDAYNCVRYLTRSEADTEVYLGCLAVTAQRLLAEPRVWRVVQAVAALLERRTLRGVEVDQMIRGVVERTIRPFQDTGVRLDFA